MQDFKDFDALATKQFYGAARSTQSTRKPDKSHKGNPLTSESQLLIPELAQKVEQESEKIVNLVLEEVDNVQNSGMLFIPEKDQSLKDVLKRKGHLLDKKFEEMSLQFVRKNRILVLNLIPGTAELIRDLNHEDPKIMHHLQAVPLATEGVGGFVDQHIGDILETIVLFHLFSTGVDIGSSVSKKLIGKGLTEDQKFSISMVSAGMATTALELTFKHGNNPDPLDTFGIGVGLIYMTAENFQMFK